VKIEPLPVAGAAVIHVEPFTDRRGLFARFYCEEQLADLLGPRVIRQVNFSSNLECGTIRGLHYQQSPHVEMKFVRCLRGEVYSVIVDMREESPTYLQWRAVQLSAAAQNMLCVPERCAHGFQSLEHDCELMYFVTSPYVPELQTGLMFDDPVLSIPWPLPACNVSDRDSQHPLLRQPVEGATA
jgi:dTDP-4-dehydrorhamnose 3,5-epimerase